jgi:proteic killer suppression protein
VHVTFKTAQLKRCYERGEEAQRCWGDAVGRRYVQRINVLYAAESVQDLFRMPPLRFHPLKGTGRGSSR